MDRDTGAKKRRRTAGLNRRAVLRHAGTGLLVGAGLSGVAAAESHSSGKPETAGRPTVVGSAPSCETLQVDYVQGNPPLTVRVEGPETRAGKLDGDDRSVSWTVPAGEYEVTASPGSGGSNGEAAVVVEGSPVTVTGCPSTDPNEEVPQGLAVSSACLASGAAVSYTVENPTDDDAVVTLTVTGGSLSFEVEREVAAGSSATVPEGSELTADGTWTHEFTATRAGGSSMTLNGEVVWTNTPDCS